MSILSLMMPLNLQPLKMSSSACKSSMMGLCFLTMDMRTITRYRLKCDVDFCDFCVCTFGDKSGYIKWIHKNQG